MPAAALATLLWDVGQMARHGMPGQGPALCDRVAALAETDRLLTHTVGYTKAKGREIMRVSGRRVFPSPHAIDLLPT
jgi:hypothetical protein